jgi:hypothetical protein
VPPNETMASCVAHNRPLRNPLSSSLHVNHQQFIMRRFSLRWHWRSPCVQLPAFVCSSVLANLHIQNRPDDPCPSMKTFTTERAPAVPLVTRNDHPVIQMDAVLCWLSVQQGGISRGKKGEYQKTTQASHVGRNQPERTLYADDTMPCKAHHVIE